MVLETSHLDKTTLRTYIHNMMFLRFIPILLSGFFLSAQGLQLHWDFTPGKQVINFQAVTPYDEEYPCEWGIKHLASVLGARQGADGTRLVDISYSALCAYTSRLPMGEDARISLRNLQTCEARELCTLACTHLFDFSQLSGHSRVLFHETLASMTAQRVGCQRVRSLLMLQFLIDHNLGEIGGSFYKGKKIQFRKGLGNGYSQERHDLEMCYFFSLQEILISPDPDALADPSASPSSTLLHELTHAYHAMLGITGGWRRNEGPTRTCIDPVRRAYLSCPPLRERLIPLLHGGVFQDLCTEVTRRGFVLKDVCETETVTSCRRFLEDNNFFGLSLPEEAPLRSAMTHLICRFIEKWDDLDEMLTIAGFVPIIFHDGARYVLLNEQNESAQLLQESKRFRLVHGDFRIISSVFGARSVEFLQILSQAIARHGVSLYSAEGESRDSLPHSPLSAEGPTQEDLERSLTEITRQFTPFLSEPRSVCLVQERMALAKKYGLSVTDALFQQLLHAGAMDPMVLACYWDGIPSERQAETLSLILEQTFYYASSPCFEQFLEFAASYALDLTTCDAFLRLSQSVWQSVAQQEGLGPSALLFLDYLTQKGMWPESVEFSAALHTVLEGGVPEQFPVRPYLHLHPDFLVEDALLRLAAEKSPDMFVSLYKHCSALGTGISPLAEYVALASWSASTIVKGLLREGMSVDVLLLLQKCIAEDNPAAHGLFDLLPDTIPEMELLNLAQAALSSLHTHSLLGFLEDHDLYTEELGTLVVGSLSEGQSEEQAYKNSRIVPYCTRHGLDIPHFPTLLDNAVGCGFVCSVATCFSYARARGLEIDVTEKLLAFAQDSYGFSVLLPLVEGSLRVEDGRLLEVLVEGDYGESLVQFLSYRGMDHVSLVEELVRKGKYGCLARIAVETGCRLPDAVVNSCVQHNLAQETSEYFKQELLFFSLERKVPLIEENLRGFAAFLEGSYNTEYLPPLQDYARSLGVTLE
jgi:hypothetical protein